MTDQINFARSAAGRLHRCARHGAERTSSAIMSQVVESKVHQSCCSHQTVRHIRVPETPHPHPRDVAPTPVPGTSHPPGRHSPHVVYSGAMQCFYHRDLSAVGLCKGCGRGVCGECAVEYAEGLACRGRCEQAVTELITLIERNRRAVVRSGRAVYAFPVFFVVIGVFFSVGGLALSRNGTMPIALGLAFIGLGLFHGFSVHRVHKPPRA